MWLFFLNYIEKRKPKIYGNVTFKSQIPTEKKELKNAKVMVVIVILAKPQ